MRLRKYRSACKRASWLPEADSACAAVRPQLPCQKGILFDSLKAPEAFASGAPLVYRLHGPQGGHFGGQRIGNRVNDSLRLIFAALFENSGSDAKTNLNQIQNYLTPFVRFPTPSHTIDDIGWLVLPVTRCIIAKNGQNARDTYMLCVTFLNEIVKIHGAELFSNEIFFTYPDISTHVWVKLHRLSAFKGKIGVMETTFPHCQQTYQHKYGTINDVM